MFGDHPFTGDKRLTHTHAIDRRHTEVISFTFFKVRHLKLVSSYKFVDRFPFSTFVFLFHHVVCDRWSTVILETSSVGFIQGSNIVFDLDNS